MGVTREIAEMRQYLWAICMLICLTLSETGTAFGDGVQIKITNDGTQDIVVTVCDMNVQ
jgi:hypothetical protein